MADGIALSVAQAAAILGCEEDRVRAAARELGGLKFGRDWVFPVATFIAALNDMAEQSRSSARPKPAASAVLQAVPKREPPALPTSVEPRGPRRAAMRTAAPSPETSTP
jgi:hypothetical protein